MPFKISSEEGEKLITLIRRAVRKYITHGEIIKTPKKIPEKFLKFAGAFVTINKVSENKKILRGCIGNPYPTNPLVKTIIQSAINASTQDYRFSPISLEELEEIIFEISILTEPKKINIENPMDYPNKIQLGVHGLIVEKGPFRGLLLPQVPVEWKWNKEDFLSQTCLKAGLSPDCWLLKETKIYKFCGIIMGEVSPNGPVHIIDRRR